MTTEEHDMTISDAEPEERLEDDELVGDPDDPEEDEEYEEDEDVEIDGEGMLNLAHRLRAEAASYPLDDDDSDDLINLLEEAASSVEILTKLLVNTPDDWLRLVPEADEVTVSEVQQLVRKWGWQIQLRLEPREG